MSCDHPSESAEKSGPVRQGSAGGVEVDTLALDHLAEFLYRDPDSFPSGADVCEALDVELRQTGRDRRWLAARRGDDLEEIGWPELAGDVREGLAPEAALKRLLGLGEAESDAAYLVEGWIA